MFLLFILLVCVSPGLASAAGVEKKPAFPRPLGYVSDYAELINADWQSRIRASLQGTGRSYGRSN